MRTRSNPLVSVLLLMLAASPATATLRSPQIPVQGTTLQQLLLSKGETLNVNTAQVYLWTFQGIGVTQPAANFSPSLQLGDGALHLVFAADYNLPKLEALPEGLPAGWYSFVQFLDFATIGVSLFDAGNALQSTNQYSFPTYALSFAVSDAQGTFYTIDDYNPGGAAHLLAYPGTGPHQGSVWLALESDGDGDFADAVFLLVGAWISPVERTSWGTLKKRFR